MQTDLEKLNSLYQSLEQRLTAIENKLEVIQVRSGSEQPILAETENTEANEPKTRESIEYSIGEFGMAWIGSIVLLFGLVFLFQYLQNIGYQLISVILGFISAGAVFSASFFIRKSFAHMANLLYFTGHILLFYITLRLHFFSSDPFINSKITGLIIISGVLAVQTWISVKRNSQALGGIVLLQMLVTAIGSNTNNFLLLVTVVASTLTVYYLYRHGWTKLVIPFISLIYITHLIWLLNNPVMGNPSGGLTSHHFGYLYLFACGLIFSLPAMLTHRKTFSNNLLITIIIWNAVGFTIILFLTVLNFFSKNYTGIFASISAFCLVWSFVLQSWGKVKITASIYALYAFVAISATIYGIYQLPKSFFLLSLQSLLVVSMALWFRSRFIVVMNSFLFLSLLFAYLLGGKSQNDINFSFALVPLITARILNWKRDRLKIKTEFLRNFNLIVGFFMTLYSLYQAVPSSYITISWILTGILFFGLSILINNVKYRWLAIACMIASAFYLFIVDLSKISIGYRVIAFLFLAIISIAVSIYYSRRLKQKKENT